MVKPKSVKAISRAVEQFGTQKALSDATGISKQDISNYVTGKRNVSKFAAMRLEEITGISRTEFRPDLSPA